MPPFQPRSALSLPDPPGSLYYLGPRDVAQPGSALQWGCRGRRFESGRPDYEPGVAKAAPGCCIVRRFGC